MNHTHLQALALAKYFGTRCVVGPQHADMYALWNTIAAVYCLEKDETDALYRLCEQDEIATIQCYDDYLVAMRTLDYGERFGTPLCLPEDVLFALTSKGRGLRAMVDMVAECGKYPTVARLRAAFAKPNIADKIAVSSVAAFLFYEGILFEKDCAKATQFAEKCLRWNDADGILMLLHYGDAAQRELCLAALYTIAQRTDLTDEYERVFARYEWTQRTTSQEATLLADYLDHNADAASTYDHTVARVARSPFISETDRKRLLCGNNRGAFDQIADLALPEPRTDRALGHLKNHVVAERQAEANQIEVCLRKQASGLVRVPALMCRDAISLAVYTKALNEWAEATAVFLDDTACASGCFAPAKNNLIIKRLAERNAMDATFVFSYSSLLSDGDVNQLTIMLSLVGRNAYMLHDVNVMVDLSACTFVLLATDRLPAPLAKVCQCVTIAPAAKEEVLSYVQATIDDYKRLYECPQLAFDQDAVVYLARQTVDNIHNAVETICRRHGFDNRACSVKRDEVGNAIATGARQIGFHIEE